MKDRKNSINTVVQLVENLEVGGLEKMVLALSSNLARERYRTVVFCRGDGGPLREEAAQYGIKVTAFHKKQGFDVRLPVRLAKELRGAKAHILHCHNYGPLVYGSIAARLSPIKGVVYTAHGVRTSREGHQRLFYRLGSVNQIVTVSENARQLLIKSCGIGADKVLTVPNGINTADYMMDIDVGKKKADLGIGRAVSLLGIVARLSPEKDHNTLLQAFSIVCEEFTDVDLVIVGDGELRAILEKKAGELAIDGRVHFLGCRRDIAEILPIFDCFVLSSRSEGLSMTLLEAMAAGLPVVATNVGGNPEVVEDEKTGLIVAHGEPQRLAAAVKRILSNRTRSRAMGDEGRRRVSQLFGIDKMV
ncbi:MAG: glycosyltransferase, partial [Candidatus Latescibacterota bacterium]